MSEFKDNFYVFSNGDQRNQAVVFIHGFPFDHQIWNYQIKFFHSTHFCISYDVRGIGRSRVGDGQYTMEMFADDLFSVIDKIKPHKPVLCGLSMGGYIALRAAEKFENLFSGLILCDTKSEADNSVVKLKRASAIKKINEEGVESFVKEFIPNCFADESIVKLGDVYNELLKRSSGFSPEGVKGCLLAMLSRTDTTEFLTKIKIPVLVLCGEMDKLTPPEVMKDMSDNIKNGQFHIIPEAGHITPLENPEEVNRRIKDFLIKIN